MVRDMRTWVFVLAVLVLCASALADAVRLRTSALVDAGAPVLLRDVAMLEGAAAEALGEVEIAGSVGESGWRRVSIEDVRAALADHASRLAISGSTCTVRTRAPVDVPEVEVETPDDEPVRADAVEAKTIRAAIARRLVQHLGVGLADARFTFDVADDGLLSRPVLDRVLVIEPLSSPRSERLVVRLRLVSEGIVVEERNVRVEAQVRATVAVVAQLMRRGETVTEEQVRAERRWLSPHVRTTLADPATAPGHEAARRLEEGDLLRGHDLRPPIVVERGQLVRVLMLNGSVGVEVVARAMNDARRGEVVSCRLENSRKSFTARAYARGRLIAPADRPRGTGGALMPPGKRHTGETPVPPAGVEAGRGAAGGTARATAGETPRAEGADG